MTTAIKYAPLLDSPKAPAPKVDKNAAKESKIAGLLKDKQNIVSENKRLLSTLFVDDKAVAEKERRLTSYEGALKKIDKALAKLGYKAETE
jgi:hypothetical protein